MSIEKDIEGIKKYLETHKPDENVIRESIYLCSQAFSDKDVKLGLRCGSLAKEYIRQNIWNETYNDRLRRGMTFEQLEYEVRKAHDDSVGQIESYYDVLRLEAPYWLDSFKLYIEKKRPIRERFYEPRRDTLIRITNAMQKLEDDELDVLFLHMPPRTGKTGDITMDTAWSCSRNPELSNLYVTYKEGLGGAFLDGFVEVITDPTYCYKDVFPKIMITETDAKNNKIDLGYSKERKKKYKTLSGKGLESGLNGEYDASGKLIIDDPLEGVQDVMSEEVLKRKQTIFDNNVMSRKKENCKLIMMGTIWDVKDLFMTHLNYIETAPEMADTRYDIVKIPALNENDESNFEYKYGVGYSTKYYQALRAKFETNDDMVGWSAQYMQDPLNRKGSVFKSEHLLYYKKLPDDIPLKVIAHGDTALGGGDFVSFPIVYYFENADGELDGYVEDVVFDNSEKTVTEPQVAAKIKKHRIRNVHFEANQGGEGYAEDVERLIREDKDYKEPLNITCDWAPTTKRKDQRIWDNAAEIRKLHFKEPGSRELQYRKFMQNLFLFTMGKNKKKHEDAADSLAGLVEYERNGSGVTVAEIIDSPL